MKRVVVCPYCHRPSPEPDMVGLTHSCTCGAVFAALEDDELGPGILRLVSGLFQDATAPVEELLEDCQVTVYEYSPEDGPQDVCAGLSEFIREVRFDCEESRIEELSLVWVVRGEAPAQEPPTVMKFESLEN